MDVAAYLSGSNMSLVVWCPKHKRGDTYCHGRVDDLDIGFFDENLAGLEAKPLDLFFGDRLAPEQLLNLSAACEVNLGLSAWSRKTNWSRSLGIRYRRIEEDR